MNKSLLISALMIFTGSVLAGCDQAKTESWYVEHPDALVKEMGACADSNTAECIVVQKAARKSMNNPEVAKEQREIQKQKWREYRAKEEHQG